MIRFFQNVRSTHLWGYRGHPQSYDLTTELTIMSAMGHMVSFMKVRVCTFQPPTPCELSLVPNHIGHWPFDETRETVEWNLDRGCLQNYHFTKKPCPLAFIFVFLISSVYVQMYVGAKYCEHIIYWQCLIEKRIFLFYKGLHWKRLTVVYIPTNKCKN